MCIIGGGGLLNINCSTLEQGFFFIATPNLSENEGQSMTGTVNLDQMSKNVQQ
jgi:hypothetical protein